MHPSYRSDKPGKAPDCGMDLTPVYDDATAGTQGMPGTVKISAEKQQVIGVRLGEVERGPGGSTLRTIGRIVPDEARVYRLTAKVDGWVRQIFPDSTGSLVKKGQRLLSVYSRDFQTAQQAYLFALNQMDRFKNGDEPDAMDRLKLAALEARTNLEGLGMSQDQIETIERTRKILQVVDLVAPASGFIVVRNVFADQRFEKGADFYRTVDLRRVWILADVFEQEARYIRPGAAAHVTGPQSQGPALDARVGDVLPMFDAASRTLKVRLELDNPGFALKPDMFVDLEFALSTPPGLVVPADAIVDSGVRKTVFVERGEGYFEPREVVTGARYGDRVAIVRGLEAGERIVVSGSFLIDSESRLKTAAAGKAGGA